VASLHINDYNSQIIRIDSAPPNVGLVTSSPAQSTA
jgi:hypothetical protein